MDARLRVRQVSKPMQMRTTQRSASKASSAYGVQSIAHALENSRRRVGLLGLPVQERVSLVTEPQIGLLGITPPSVTIRRCNVIIGQVLEVAIRGFDDRYSR